MISLRSLAVSGGILNHAGAALVPPDASSKMLPCTYTHPKNTHTCCQIVHTHPICTEQLNPRTSQHTCRRLKQVTKETMFLYYRSVLSLRLRVVMILLIEVCSQSSIMEQMDKESAPSGGVWGFPSAETHTHTCTKHEGSLKISCNIKPQFFKSVEK